MSTKELCVNAVKPNPIFFGTGCEENTLKHTYKDLDYSRYCVHLDLNKYARISSRQFRLIMGHIYIMYVNE